MNRGTGWRAPEELQRASHYGIRLDVPVRALPERVVLGNMPAVYDQGMTGSCVPQALAAAMEILAPRAGYPAERPDRAALYWRSRQAIGRTGEDSGAIIADGISALRLGWEREGEDPPPFWGPAWVRSPNHLAPDAPRLVSAEPLDFDPNTIAWELASGHPVAVGLRITAQWDAPEDGALPEPEGPSTAGHAVLLVGYDRPAGMWKARNSWGTGWAEGGHVWLPWAWTNLPWCGEVHSLRVIRRAPQ